MVINHQQLAQKLQCSESRVAHCHLPPSDSLSVVSKVQVMAVQFVYVEMSAGNVPLCHAVGYSLPSINFKIRHTD